VFGDFVAGAWLGAFLAPSFSVLPMLARDKDLFCLI
jgi:hypothetical protein